jgi:epoxyqueuosine reductase
MEQVRDFTKKLIKFSKKIGVDLIGFADPKLFDHFAKEFQPYAYLKETKSVIIIGIHLYDIMLDVWSKNEEIGKSIQFADSILKNYCNSISKFLSKHDYKSKIIPYNPGLYLKDSAALAGIGPIGKNNLLITKEFGSQVRLRAIVTAAPLEFGNPIYESSYCKECHNCIDACPANAFPNQLYSKSICLDYNHLNWRKLSNYTRLWCNKCIESCPVGRGK